MDADTIKELRSLRPSAIVSLYEIDLSPINVSQVFRFVDSVLGAPVYFGGAKYIPWPIAIDGLALSTTGPLPEPTVKLFNYENTIIELLDLYDPRGALFTHRMVWRRHLDDGTDPNTAKQFEPDQYTIHAYNMGDTCSLVLASALADLNQDFPKETIAMVRDAP